MIKILTVDDSKTMSKIMEMVFAFESVDLMMLFRGEEVLAKALEFRPDIVIADISMTHDGYQICEEIRSHPKIQNIPVMLLASQHHPYDEAKGQSSKVTSHVHKPFQTQVFVDHVYKIIEANKPHKVDEFVEDIIIDTEEDISIDEVDVAIASQQEVPISSEHTMPLRELRPSVIPVQNVQNATITEASPYITDKSKQSDDVSTGVSSASTASTIQNLFQHQRSSELDDDRYLKDKKAALKQKEDRDVVGDHNSYHFQKSDKDEIFSIDQNLLIPQSSLPPPVPEKVAKASQATSLFNDVSEKKVSSDRTSKTMLGVHSVKGKKISIKQDSMERAISAEDINRSSRSEEDLANYIERPSTPPLFNTKDDMAQKESPLSKTTLKADEADSDTQDISKREQYQQKIPSYRKESSKSIEETSVFEVPSQFMQEKIDIVTESDEGGDTDISASTKEEVHEKPVDLLEQKFERFGLTKEQIQEIFQLSREIIYQVVWEVIPDLAETMVQEEIKKLMKEDESKELSKS